VDSRRARGTAAVRSHGPATQRHPGAPGRFSRPLGLDRLPQKASTVATNAGHDRRDDRRPPSRGARDAVRCRPPRFRAGSPRQRGPGPVTPRHRTAAICTASWTPSTRRRGSTVSLAAPGPDPGSTKVRSRSKVHVRKELQLSVAPDLGGALRRLRKESSCRPPLSTRRSPASKILPSKYARRASSTGDRVTTAYGLA